MCKRIEKKENKIYCLCVLSIDLKCIPTVLLIGDKFTESLFNYWVMQVSSYIFIIITYIFHEKMESVANSPHSL